MENIGDWMWTIGFLQATLILAALSHQTGLTTFTYLGIFTCIFAMLPLLHNTIKGGITCLTGMYPHRNS